MAWLETHIRIDVLDSPGEDLAAVLGPVRAARELVDERVGGVMVCEEQSVSRPLYTVPYPPLTKLLVEPLVVADGGPEGRKVKHDGALAPVGAVGRVVRDLAEEVKVRLADCPVKGLATSLASYYGPTHT